MSKTISITIPDQLETELQDSATKIGISRSRFICNLLLDWQKLNTLNDCIRRRADGTCMEYQAICRLSQAEAVECDGYAN